MSRVDGPVLLVGSVPGRDAEEVMRFCAGELRDNLSFFPDGETGFRKIWINFLAATIYAANDAYFSPLSDWPENAGKLFLGLVHHTGSVEGTKRRLATAKRHINNFGIATECGFGRRTKETLPKLMRIHREIAELL